LEKLKRQPQIIIPTRRLSKAESISPDTPRSEWAKKSYFEKNENESSKGEILGEIITQDHKKLETELETANAKIDEQSEDIKNFILKNAELLDKLNKTRNVRQKLALVNETLNYQNAKQQTQINSLTAEKRELIKENKSQIETLKKDIENKQKQINKLERLSSGRKSIVEKRESKIKSLEAEKQDLIQQLEIAQNERQKLVKELENKLATAKNHLAAILTPLPEDPKSPISESEKSSNPKLETSSETSELPPYEGKESSPPNYEKI